METRPQKPSEAKQTPENFIKDIRRKTRRIFSSEQKILLVMEALRGEDSVAAIPQTKKTTLPHEQTSYLTPFPRVTKNKILNLNSQNPL